MLLDHQPVAERSRQLACEVIVKLGLHPRHLKEFLHEGGLRDHLGLSLVPELESAHAFVGRGKGGRWVIFDWLRKSVHVVLWRLHPVLVVRPQVHMAGAVAERRSASHCADAHPRDRPPTGLHLVKLLHARAGPEVEVAVRLNIAQGAHEQGPRFVAREEPDVARLKLEHAELPSPHPYVEQLDKRVLSSVRGQAARDERPVVNVHVRE
mmetsp:Transcript_11789/g.37801  ORF Transcript_11789/g.37801 Transcript_11789/m.37801 type:complete len:209 (+) Transcript_11789:2610-3236(+)